MLYRTLEESEIQRVIPLYIEHYNHYEGGAWSEATTYRRIHQVVTREDSYSLVLEDGANVIAFAMGYFEQYDDGKVYDLIEIVVAHEYQRLGIGSSFMCALEQKVKDMGAFMIQLEAVNDEQHNHFYGKLGYKDASNLVLKSKLI